MKILILHQHFNTPDKGGALRSYFLAKALVDRGIETVVITSHNQQHYSMQLVEGIEVHYLPVAYSNVFGFYKRIGSFLRYAAGAVRLGSGFKNVNVCYAMSTPLTVGFAALVLKWRKQVPFIFEVGDLWPDAPVQLGFVKNPLLKGLLYFVEKFIYQRAESIVALSTTMQTIIRKKVPDKTVHLIPNMADLEFFKPAAKDAGLIEKFGVKDRFVISYIGSVGFANGLEFVIDCARLTEKAGLPVTFLICGEGAVLPYLTDTAKKLAIENLKFIPFQSRVGVQEVMNVTDAVLISYRQHAILETGSPNKYFDGLAAGKLIIANVGGWIKEEIEQAGCGFSVHANHPDELITKLQPYVKNADRLAAAQQKARTVASRYDKVTLSKVFVYLFQRFNGSI